MHPLTPKQRDEFLDKAAMVAMQGMLSNPIIAYATGDVHEGSTKDAFKFAQALLAERDRREQVKE